MVKDNQSGSFKRNVGILTTASLSLTGATFLITRDVLAVTGVLAITFLLLACALLRSSGGQKHGD